MPLKVKRLTILFADADDISRVERLVANDAKVTCASLERSFLTPNELRQSWKWRIIRAGYPHAQFCARVGLTVPEFSARTAQDARPFDEIDGRIEAKLRLREDALIFLPP